MPANLTTPFSIDVYNLFYVRRSDSSCSMWKLTTVHDWKMLDRCESSKKTEYFSFKIRWETVLPHVLGGCAYRVPLH